MEEASSSTRSGRAEQILGGSPPVFDVFISHCGQDCKRDFADMLRERLEFSGLRCFFDDRDLKLGDNASDTMLAAMRTARYGVAIISRGFFQREWCVKELQTFLERGNLFPIFLPTPFQAPSELEGGDHIPVFLTNPLEVPSEVVALDILMGFRWSVEEYLRIVRGASSFTGVRLEAHDGYWSRCILEVKKELLRRLHRLEGGPKLSDSDRPLFNIEENLEALKKLMGLRGDGTQGQGGAQLVGIVAVKGMGGVGKTTLAKRVYDDPEVRAFFDHRVCWLAVNQNPHNRVCQLQQQLLAKLADVRVEISSPEEGRSLIRQSLGTAKVLICLDDVWADGQPSIVSRDLLGLGSCILQTTRDANTVELGGHRLDLDILGPSDSRQLFSFHAFRRHPLLEEYQILVDRTLHACAGLPLALVVAGSAVAKMLEKGGVSRWNDFLTVTMGNTPEGATVHNILRSSYDDLPSQEYKDAFVLVAWMWPPVLRDMIQSTVGLRAKEVVKRNLGALLSGGQAQASLVLQELEDRSLLRMETGEDVAAGDHVAVHDLLVDVAGRIARSKGRFSKSSVVGSFLNPHSEHMSLLNSTNLFQLQDNLFQLHMVQSLLVDSAFRGFSASPFRLWGSPGHNLCRLLCLRGCWQLKTLPESLGRLSDLKVLDLTYCSNLKALPRSIGKLAGLVVLDLSFCHSLEVLPELGLMAELTVLALKSCKSLKRLPGSWDSLIKLKRVDLSNCVSLEQWGISNAQTERLSRLKILVTDNGHLERIQSNPPPEEEVEQLRFQSPPRFLGPYVPPAPVLQDTNPS